VTHARGSGPRILLSGRRRGVRPLEWPPVDSVPLTGKPPRHGLRAREDRIVPNRRGIFIRPVTAAVKGRDPPRAVRNPHKATLASCRTVRGRTAERPQGCPVRAAGKAPNDAGEVNGAAPASTGDHAHRLSDRVRRRGMPCALDPRPSSWVISRPQSADSIVPVRRRQWRRGCGVTVPSRTRGLSRCVPVPRSPSCCRSDLLPLPGYPQLRVGELGLDGNGILFRRGNVPIAFLQQDQIAGATGAAADSH